MSLRHGTRRARRGLYPGERMRLMPSHVIAIDAVAILFAVIGFLMAFRQRLVRRLLGGRAARRIGTEESEDPLHHALLIFGMMILAFGLILFGFTTFYALLTG